METEKMLECPFCGAEAEYRDDLSDEGKGEYSNHVVMCTQCVGCNSGNSEKDAIFYWNLRSENKEIKSLQSELKESNKQIVDNTIMIDKFDDLTDKYTELESELTEEKKNSKDWKNNCDDSDELIKSLEVELTASKENNKKLAVLWSKIRAAGPTNIVKDIDKLLADTSQKGE